MICSMYSFVLLIVLLCILISIKSVVAVHAINNVHEITWKDVKILDKEPNYNKRIISEMLHINIV